MSQTLLVFKAVLVCFLVSSVVCDVEDNLVVTENSLQDLTIRTKKSPAREDKNTFSESKSNPELKAILKEDIKRQLNELKSLKRESDQLKELENAYRRIEAGFYETVSNAPDDKLDSRLPLDDGVSSEEAEDDSVRIVRTLGQKYKPYFQKENQIQTQNYNSKNIFPSNAYSNEKYQPIYPPNTNSHSYRDDPYIAAQYNPDARTFGAAASGLQGGFTADFHGVAQLKPVHTMGGVKPAEGGLHQGTHASAAAVSVQPTHTAPAVEDHKPIPEHKPHEVYTHPVKPHKAPLFYEKKEIGLPGKFFSKQIIFGPSGEFGSSFSHTPTADESFSPYHYGESTKPYYAPSYGYSSSFPQGYGVSYGVSAAPYSWYPTDSYLYSNSPELQSYGYGTAYSLSPYYQQGQSYYPLSGGGYSSLSPYYQQGNLFNPSFGGGYSSGYSSRSNREASDYQLYRDELDSLVSQFFRADSPAREAAGEQLKETIEKDQKKILALQEMSQNPAYHSDSFISWLDDEVNSLYSRWLSFKDGINKSKQESKPSQQEKKTI